jgi:hypothetical protein
MPGSARDLHGLRRAGGDASARRLLAARRLARPWPARLGHWLVVRGEWLQARYGTPEAAAMPYPQPARR